MKYSKILGLISTFLISVAVYSVPVSEHATSTQEFENEPASRQASVPGLIKPGFQLPLFPKPPTLLKAFPSRGPKWKKLAENFVYDNFSEELSYSWELSDSVEAINANKCNGIEDASWRNISDEYLDDTSFSWQSVKVEKQSIASTKRGSTVLYIVTLEAFLVYKYTDASDKTHSYTCTVPVNQYVIKNKKIKTSKEVEEIFMGFLD